MVSKKRDLTYWTNRKATNKAKQKPSSKSTHTPLNFQWKQDSKNIVNLLKEKVKESITSNGNSLNPRRVGRVGGSKAFSFALQPHNYRRYYDFDTTTQSEATLLKKITKVGLVGFKFSKKNYGKESHLENFWGCRVIIRKKSVEVINQWYGKKWRLVEGNTIEEIDNKIDFYSNELIKQCDTAVKKLIQYGGGKSDLILLKARGEIGIHGDEYLDSLPDDLIIHDTYFKKTYKKKTEFYLDKKGKPGYVKNYIANRALERVSPEIEERLDELKAHSNMLWEGIKGIVEVNKSTADTFNSFATNFLPIHKEHATNIKTHTRVLKGISKSFNKFNALLSQRKLGDYYK